MALSYPAFAMRSDRVAIGTRVMCGRVVSRQVKVVRLVAAVC